jgi:hypothetical protein
MSDSPRYIRVAGYYGDDSPPLMNLVPEAPPSHWGKMTSQQRTTSPQYLKFLQKKVKTDGRRTR